MDIEEKLNKIDKKVDLILELLDTDLKKNCENCMWWRSYSCFGLMI